MDWDNRVTLVAVIATFTAFMLAIAYRDTHDVAMTACEFVNAEHAERETEAGNTDRIGLAVNACAGYGN